MSIGERVMIRFLGKIRVCTHTGWWRWQGNITKGYGGFWDGKRHRAHRWSYQSFVGVIPRRKAAKCPT